jgi:hypothetical protein
MLADGKTVYEIETALSSKQTLLAVLQQRDKKDWRSC